jgi:hypothetical protein
LRSCWEFHSHPATTGSDRRCCGTGAG